MIVFFENRRSLSFWDAKGWVEDSDVDLVVISSRFIDISMLGDEMLA
ncbi:MAG: hypothetical protein RMJ00_07285 [Nitrososphaerota archaeon]|nr:hypothetical protein [Candidatus Bathyarchaeota archaeon]MCX8162696.1 hypothetical protein [Candidatus Bathyarchaeota archaeon]MDW8062481.1 hypothetical protein [Nitrososphaerota archaeon]